MRRRRQQRHRHVLSVPRATCLPSKRPLLIGAEAAGLGLDTDRHGASLTKGTPGVLHGFYSYLLQDDAGQSARGVLDLAPGSTTRASVPSTAYLKDEGLVRYEARDRRRGARRIRAAARRTRASSPRSRAATRSRCCRDSPTNSGPTRRSSSPSPAAATRTWTSSVRLDCERRTLP